MGDVRIEETVRTTEALIAPQLRAKGLDFAATYGPNDTRVSADPEKLQQILLNLLTNAVKFTERGGVVRIDVEPAGPLVRLHVSDTGVGIPTEKLERIFEPFVQVDPNYTREHEGVGLGLAISRDLARGMGGDLTVESTEGAGSRFTLTLAACAA
jgi:signal transduction histidine kinase